MTNSKWIMIRQLGKSKYALLYGSLFWGCICATATITPLILTNKVNNIFFVFIYYLLWIIGGFFYGKHIWEKQEMKSEQK